jgi:plasmid maintenance system antidote protein VapI
VKTTAKFLDDLRAKLGVPSDNKLAAAMGWKRQQVTPYRQNRETFSDQTAVRIAEVLGVRPDYIMACMAFQRAKTPETRKAWERIAAKVAACFVLGIALQGAPAPAPAAILHNQNVPTAPAPLEGADNTHMRQFGFSGQAAS